MKITELEPVPRNRRGKFLKNGVKLEPHEEATAKFLILYGFTIDVMKPVNTPKVKNPDFLINGVIWETKSPEGVSKKNIERKFHEASRQAHNLIIDLRRIRQPAKSAEQETVKQFFKSSGIKHLMIITKEEKLLDYRK